jgi:SAM-dependent methyltransferase
MTDFDEELHTRRASSFGPQAAAYDEHRPDYPQAAVRWIAQPIAGRPAPRVLDLAAGTGKLTRTLTALGMETTAVEPDAGMLALLRGRLPQVESLPGTAEQIPLPDASVDVVFVGQALHWFDLDRAFPEIARVLRPGGVLGALWNTDDRTVEWVDGLARMSGLKAGVHRDPGVEHPAGLFEPSEHKLFDHVQRRTADSLTATIATHSQVLVMPQEERTRLLTGIRAYLGSRPETARGEFDLPIVTLAIRWRSLPDAG